MSVLRTYSRFGIQRITSSVHKRCYTDSTKSTDSNLPTNTDSTKSTDSNLPTKTSKLDRVPKAGEPRPVKDVLMYDLESMKTMKPPGTLVPREIDILIVGGGAIGSSIAYWLRHWTSKTSKVMVVERDPVYTRASTMLSAGGIRHQFSVPENVQLSMFGSEWLRDIKEHLSVLHESPPDIQFNHQGYLFLAPPRGAAELNENVQMQTKLGAKVELYSKSQLAEKFPWMNLDGIECGSYGLEGEGWFDPWSFVRALKQKNLSLGVEYVHGEVQELLFESCSHLGHEKIDGAMILAAKDGREYETKAAIIVNAAGPWAADLAEMAGIGVAETSDLYLPLPVEPRKRFVYVTHCPDGPMLDCPFVVDPSGVYVRREGFGGHYICGASPPSVEEEPDVANFDVDYDFYNEFIWPQLANRIPAFNNSKLKSAWAGYYDYNPFDQNLIIGKHPYHHNFIFANGLSGHGLQHSIGVGRAVSELILDGAYQTIDLSRFSFERFIKDLPIEEGNIV